MIHECVDCSALPELPGDPLVADEDVEYRPVRRRPISDRSTPRRPRCKSHQKAAERAEKARRAEARVRRTYGLGPGEYDALYAFQDGRCAICRRATGRVKRLAVDHDHETGQPRGLCCGPCNLVILGRYGPEALQRAIDYLADPPYNRMHREAS